MGAASARRCDRGEPGGARRLGDSVRGARRRPTLTGRRRECDTLDRLIAGVRSGRSGVLVVRGEAGIGKSALLDDAVGSASGFKVARATGVESEMELPFAGLHLRCAPMLDRVALLPEPQRDAVLTAFGLTAGRPPDRFFVGLALLSLLCEVSEQAPLLCVIDDAQWLDQASAEALTFVARRLLAERIFLVFATRAPSKAFTGLPELALRGLGVSDARALLASVLRTPLDDRVRDRIIAETHGNPLALLEWPRGLPPAQLAGGIGLPTMLPVSGQIEESFRRRVSELPPATQHVLTVAAPEPTGDPGLVWRTATRLG